MSKRARQASSTKETTLIPREEWDRQHNSRYRSVQTELSDRIETIARLHAAMQRNRGVREALEEDVRPHTSTPSFALPLLKICVA